jgi:hypothetical protein
MVMEARIAVVVAALIGLGFARHTAAAQGSAVTYLNAEVVGIDPPSHTLTIKDPRGAQRDVSVDANVVLSDLKRGDKVILTLRPDSEGVASQVVGVRLSAAGSSASPTPTPLPGPDASPNPSPRPSPTPVPSPSPKPTPGALTDVQLRAVRERAALQFNDRVAAFAVKADEIDRVWQQYKAACRVVLTRPYEGGREWFALWDGTAKMEPASTACEDFFNQVVHLGEPLKVQMAAAEEDARKASLLPATISEIRRRYSLDWDGWEERAPAYRAG